MHRSKKGVPGVMVLEWKVWDISSSGCGSLGSWKMVSRNDWYSRSKGEECGDD